MQWKSGLRRVGARDKQRHSTWSAVRIVRFRVCERWWQHTSISHEWKYAIKNFANKMRNVIVIAISIFVQLIYNFKGRLNKFLRNSPRSSKRRWMNSSMKNEKCKPGNVFNRTAVSRDLCKIACAVMKSHLAFRFWLNLRVTLSFLLQRPCRAVFTRRETFSI